MSTERPDKDAPLRLAAAAKWAFPDAMMTASGLRREAARGRLEIWLINGRLYTSLAEIERMKEKCRVPANKPASGSGPPGVTNTDESLTLPGSLSKTVADRLARDAAKDSVRKLREGLPLTSSKNMNPIGSNVTSLRSV